MEHICKECKKHYNVSPCRDNKTKYCSRKCANIGIARRPVTWGNKIGIANKGNKRPDLSEYNKNNLRTGELNWRWNPNRTELLEKLRIRSSSKYAKWRKAVFERDNFTCQVCGKRGGWIEAHHIKSFSLFPKLRFDVKNGMTLCRDCHIKTLSISKRNYLKH